jgi:RsiW-degrading membrane proteinase PrsW (M82 family)
MSAFRARFRFGVVGCVLAAIAIAALAAVVLLVAAAVPDPVGLALSVAAASVPALIYAAIVLRLDRYEIEPVRAVVACFAWGAVGAVLLSVIFGLILQAALVDQFGALVATIASTVIGAPLIEETFKGIAVLAVLVVARDEFDSTLDGLVYGALVGVGFAMTENILYFGQTYLVGGFDDFGEMIIARAVLGGFGHPAYTAITGAAIGWARGRYGRGFARFVVPILGWAVAVALHAAWNGGFILVAGLYQEEMSLLEAAALLTAITLVPAVLVLYAIARLSARHELQILRDALPAEVALGTITDAEYQTIVDTVLRRQALAAARTRGGRALRGRQLAFFHTAAELGFRNHHRRSGEPSTPRHAERDASDRQRLAELRQELALVEVIAIDR